MKITRVEVDKLNIKLPEPLAISFHTFYYQENYFLRLYTDDGLVGWGEGAPFKPITGDSQDEVFSEIKGLRLSDIPPLESADKFFDAFAGRFASHSLSACFDMAAHDLLARRRSVPVYRLYADRPNLTPNSITVFIKDTLERTVENAREIYAKYPHLKLLKIKLKGHDDVDRCVAIKSVSPEHMKFVLDANQGFDDPKEGLDVLTRIMGILGDVVAIEQPCPKGHDEKMKYIADHIQGTKIMADESCCDESDVRRIVAGRLAHGLNIKLQKAGGITPAKRMAKLAGEAGLSVMVGSMFEDPLATASGVHFAVTTPNVMLTDLDMDMDLPPIFTGICRFQNASRIPLDEPGFGFSLRSAEAIGGCPAGLVDYQPIARIDR